MALSDMNLLSKFGYLSTVSGGGFAGGWFMMHERADANLGQDPAKLEAKLFKRGGNDLYHLSQWGAFLGVTNTNDGTGGVVMPLLSHIALLPFHWLVNEAYDYRLNIPWARIAYRRGIWRAFEYPRPLEGEAFDIEDEQIRSIAAYPPDASKPFWIVNMHLVLGDDGANYRGRTGDAFELTPQRAGADAVGYVNVPPVLGEEDFWMSPYYALAISGAAIDSKSGAQSAVLSKTIDFFNFDLGYNVNGWSRGWNENDPFWGRAFRNALYLAPLPWPFYELLPSHKYTVRSKNYRLTDGGHFDNLGLYALIRRGVRLIVIADGTQDSRIDGWCKNKTDKDFKRMALAFDDLHRTETKLYSDFGVNVEWNWDQLCSDNQGVFKDQVPSYVFTGRIRNFPVGDDGSPRSDVFIVYVKAAYNQDSGLLKDSGFMDQEKAVNDQFPNDSTENQFFSEREVVSQRELGRRQLESGSKGATLLRAGIAEFCLQEKDVGGCLKHFEPSN